MSESNRSQITGLVADIGGTYTRLALFHPPDGLCRFATRRNADFSGVAALLQSYLAELPDGVARPTRAAVAVACPVGADTVQLTNLAWSFSSSALARELNLQSLQVVNDFAAIALSLPQLEPAGLVPVCSGTPMADAALAVLGPGTGLGVSGLIPHAQGWAVLTAEGGHVTLSPASDEEYELLKWLRARYGHASAERVLSGPGLADLYRFAARGGLENAPAPEEITHGAMTGGDAHAVHAFELFFSLLGTTAGNLALTLGARGGVYLAGGILPRVQGLLMSSAFCERFVAKGRFRAYLEAIPVQLIVDPYPALKGLCTTLPGSAATEA